MSGPLRLTAQLVVSFGLCISAAGQVAAGGLEVAVAQSRKTGLPMFVIGSGQNCGFCKALKERLSTEGDLQQLLTQYVPLVIDVEDPDFNTWRQLYKPTGNGLPMLFIVTSKGEEIYNRSRAPEGDGLKQLLVTGIEKTGGPKDLSKIYPPAKDEKKLQAAVRSAKSHLAKKHPTEAIAALVAHTDPPKTADKEDKPDSKFAALAAKVLAQPEPEKTGAAKEIAELLSQLSEDAKALLAKAVNKLKSDATESQMFGAVFLIEARRTYARLPGIAEAVEQQIASLRGTAEGPKLLEQAEAIDTARVWEAKENLRAAIAVYRKVVASYPDTAASTVSQKRIEQLGSTGTSAAETNGAGGATASADPGADQKKAVAFLKLAKSFAGTRAEKAKEYAAKVIELVPNSAEAKEARQLIETLK